MLTFYSINYFIRQKLKGYYTLYLATLAHAHGKNKTVERSPYFFKTASRTHGKPTVANSLARKVIP